MNKLQEIKMANDIKKKMLKALENVDPSNIKIDQRGRLIIKDPKLIETLDLAKIPLENELAAFLDNCTCTTNQCKAL